VKQIYLLLVSRRQAGMLLIAIAALGTYVNSLDNAFQYDDRHSIVENPHIRDAGNIPDFFARPDYFSRDPEKAMYRPLLLVSYALNYAWSGSDVRSYHWVNATIHALCSILLWGIILHLGRPPCMALLAALVFAVHPLCSEPVNYISSRSELLAALGVLASFWFYLRCEQTEKTRWLALSLFCFAFGLLSKSVAIILPVWLLVWDYLRGHRMADIWKRYIPYAALAGGYLLLVRNMLLKAVVDEPVRSWGEQVGTQLKALVYYGYLAVVPLKLNVHHAFAESGLDSPLVWVCVFALASLLLMGRRPVVLLAIAMALSSLLPTLVVPLNVLVNEHRLYLSVAGMMVAIFSLARLESLPGLRWGAPLIVVVMALLTMSRNEVWRDEYSLWSDALKNNPGAVRAHVYMGNYARARGDAQRALIEYERALGLDADNAVAGAGMANAYQDLGRIDDAITQFDDLLQRHPQMTDLHYSLGRALQQAGRLMEARNQYAALPERSPHYAIALNNMGTTFELAGELDSALVLYRSAGQRGAEDGQRNLSRLVEMAVSRGEKAFQIGDYTAAEQWSRTALVGDDHHAYARFFLSVALMAQGRYREAIIENELLVRAHPSFDEGRLQLANAYETAGEKPEAERIYEALEKDGVKAEMREIAGQRLRRLREGER
jgi:protein O-mannosyl-transferase